MLLFQFFCSDVAVFVSFFLQCFERKNHVWLIASDEKPQGKQTLARTHTNTGAQT